MSTHTFRDELAHIPTKWIPVGRKKVLKANILERLSDPPGSENDLGYSLLELLVVLCVLALAAAVTMPQFAGSRGATALRGGERAVIEAVRQLRSEAIGTNSVAWMEIEPGGRAIRTSAGRRLGLPAGVSVAPVRLAFTRMHFYPDGRSSGTAWRLTGGGVGTVVSVDWLTGRIQASVDPP